MRIKKDETLGEAIKRTAKTRFKAISKKFLKTEDIETIYIKAFWDGYMEKCGEDILEEGKRIKEEEKNKIKLIIEKEPIQVFDTLEQLKVNVSNRYSIQPFQVYIDNDNNVVLNNKLGESFAYIGIVKY